MSLEKDTNAKTKNAEVSDVQVEQALRHFRESIHGWSEQEFARPRSLEPVRRGVSWWVARHLGVAWALAAVLLVGGVSVPVGVHFRNDAHQALLRKAQDEARQRQAIEDQKQAYAIDDDELMRHVDSDIAQGTPDAMEPLASLMTGTRSKSATAK